MHCFSSVPLSAFAYAFAKRMFFVAMALWPILTTGQILQPQALQIPMSDGKFLAADLYLPNDQDTFPVILIQTPYNKNLFKLGLPLGVGLDLATSPYAFVILDWRCFYGSISACTATPDRGQDGYDAVEWIAAQPWCNEKVATWGLSALGNIQFQTARKQPPHLVCAIPMVAAPYTHYELYYPGGALRSEYLAALNALFGSSGFEAVVANPHYNLLWSIAENGTMYPSEIEVPMLMIGGWFDHNTNDNLLLFDTLRALSPVAAQHRLLMGPWTHGGIGKQQQGDLSFPEAANWHNKVANDFLAYHLFGEDNGWEQTPPVLYFQTGDNEWFYADAFPPPPAILQDLILTENGGLSPVPPFADSARLTFSYDPENPSPTIGGKTLDPQLLQGPYDQSAGVEDRDDVLAFTTGVLTEALRVQGRIDAVMFVGSDRPDTGLALRLTDVQPDGRSILVGETILRLRFRNGFSAADTALLHPDSSYNVRLQFDHLAHTFQAGHQLRLLVSGSNYPRYNRNMNTGDPMYPNGHIDTLVNPVVAHNALLVQGIFLSRIRLPLATITAVTQSGANETLGVFPNPAGHYFEVENLPAPGVLYLYDQAGQLAGQFRVKQSGAAKVYAGDLPGGVYHLLFISWQNGAKKSLSAKIVLGR